jgi:hypothetical protein
VKGNCWKEIAGEWQGCGMGTAWYVWIGLKRRSLPVGV